MNKTKLLKEIKDELGEYTIEQEKIIENLSKEYPILQEITYDEFNVRDIQLLIPDLTNKYFRFYILEKNKYELLEKRLESLIGERYDYYRFESPRELTPKEIEKYYIPKDEEIKLLKRLLLFQSVKVDYFKMCCDEVKGLTWRIKNYLEILRRGL